LGLAGGFSCSSSSSRARRVWAARPRPQCHAISAAAADFQYLPLDLPPPQNTKVVSSVFVTSNAAVADCPRDRKPEFAVIGRSNVGKSSLLNCLTNNSKLARVSKEPGALKLPAAPHAAACIPACRM
jgi:hypothetical protein